MKEQAASIFPDNEGQYWLHKTRPNQVPKCLQQVPMEFCSKLIPELFTNWLTSDKHNLITAKATGWFFSPFNVASALEVSFGIPQYVQCILHGLTSVLLCVAFLATVVYMIVHYSGLFQYFSYQSIIVPTLANFLYTSLE